MGQVYKWCSCVGTETVASVSAVDPRDHGGLPGSRAAAAQHQRNDLTHIASQGKDPNSKFKLWFLLHVSCLCTTAKLK